MVGRDANGRFVKGHPPTNNGKGGRQKRATEEKYIRAMMKEVPATEWSKVLRTGIQLAKAGDLGWAKFIASYLMGLPKQRLDIGQAEGQEWIINLVGSNINAGDL
jgi:hypothetical protein